MDKQARSELRTALGALHVDAAPFTDCLWVILAEYFEGHPSCPETDPDPDEFGFGEWVMHEADRALDVIAALIEKREADLRTALAAATERAEAAERARDRLREYLSAIDLMIPAGITHEGADTDDAVRDLADAYLTAIGRADALAARLREVGGEQST